MRHALAAHSVRMPEIAFHFNAPDKLAYVCRLLRKAISQDAKLVVCADAPTLQALDTQLWTFAPLEFVAHCRGDSPLALLQASPVILVSDLLDLSDHFPHRQVLVNLSPVIIKGFEVFERVIEVVSLDAQDRQHARLRWKHYNDLGYSITRHDLKLRETST